MKFVYILVVMALVSGCGKQHTQATVAHAPELAQTACLDGVSYYIMARFNRGYMAVKYNRDGTIETC